MKIKTQKINQESLEEIFYNYETIPSEYNNTNIENEIRDRERKPQQFARAAKDEEIGLDCVQSFISNMSTWTSIDELIYFDGVPLPDNLLSSDENEWTAPKWAKAGDIVFFMHSKTARSSITRLRTELYNTKELYDPDLYKKILKTIDHSLEVHTKYGGKIFAIGRICGAPEYIPSTEIASNMFHWKSRNYSAIDNIIPLDHPIDISEFNDFIYVTRGGSITPLYDRDFTSLRNLISKNNVLPSYVTNSVSKPIPLREINKHNWIDVANDYRRCFILEKQFRSFYVDYLISALGDQRKFYTECRCKRSDIHDSFMDYVMLFSKKYLPVEVKLSVAAESNILAQVSKYVHNSHVFLTPDGSKCVTGKEFHFDKVLVVDTEKIYMYDAKTNAMTALFDLDNLQTRADIEKLKEIIVGTL